MWSSLVKAALSSAAHPSARGDRQRSSQRRIKRASLVSTANGWYLRIAANTSVVVENQKNDDWAPELRTASCCESKNHSG